jgi:hypothetical protein
MKNDTSPPLLNSRTRKLKTGREAIPRRDMEKPEHTWRQQPRRAAEEGTASEVGRHREVRPSQGWEQECREAVGRF